MAASEARGHGGSALARGALGLALALGAGSCIRLNWSREMVETPIPAERLAELAPGEELGRCMELLGAPLLVLELGDGGSALIYGWSRQSGFGFRASAPVKDAVSASFDYDSLERRAQGVLVQLDAGQRVVLVRRGLLADLLAETGRKRPAFDGRWVERAAP